MPHLSSCLLVYDCSTSDDAEALYEAMQTDQVDVDFGQVKRALEANNSKRMSVTCASVGSLWKQDYFAEGIACSGEVPPVRAIVGGIIGGLVAVILLCSVLGTGKDKSIILTESLSSTVGLQG